MTMLTAIQNFCRRSNITVPTTVVGSTDSQILQVMALMEEAGDSLSNRHSWQDLVNEAIHTTVATESQGAIRAIASNNFNYIKNNTIWDRSQRLPVFVLDGGDWQAVKAFAVNGPRYHARIRGGDLLSNPVPPAGDTWVFEYVTYNWILDTDGTTEKQYFTSDTDTFLIPESLLIAGLKWRWKKEKGFDYGEDFDTYEALVVDAIGRDGLKRNLHADDKMREPAPGIIIDQGTWNL